jgi:hypothetical protein
MNIIEKKDITTQRSLKASFIFIPACPSEAWWLTKRLRLAIAFKCWTGLHHWAHDNVLIIHQAFNIQCICFNIIKSLSGNPIYHLLCFGEEWPAVPLALASELRAGRGVRIDV